MDDVLIHDTLLQLIYLFFFFSMFVRLDREFHFENFTTCLHNSKFTKILLDDESAVYNSYTSSELYTHDLHYECNSNWMCLVTLRTSLYCGLRDPYIYDILLFAEFLVARLTACYFEGRLLHLSLMRMCKVSIGNR